MLNFVQVFESNKTTRHTHTEKKGACHRLFIFESRGVPVYPLPLFPLSLCAAVVVLVSCRFQAAEQQLQSAQTFPYILIHFYCHAHEHTAPNSPRPSPTLSSTAKSNSHRAGGSFSFLFPRCLASIKKKKRKNFFCTMNFCAFSTCMSRSSPAPLPQLPPLFLQEIDSLCLSLACLWKISIFHSIFPSLVVAAKVTALG